METRPREIIIELPYGQLRTKRARELRSLIFITRVGAELNLSAGCGGVAKVRRCQRESSVNKRTLVLFCYYKVVF